jgi:hypothetical protein
LLTVREHLGNEIADYLPELLRTGIQQANLQQRTQQLERMTQEAPMADGPHPELLTSAPDLTEPDASAGGSVPPESSASEPA